MDYLSEKLKREMKSKSVQQAGYLIVKGLLAKNGNGNDLFRHLDVLFDIPQEEEKPKKSKEELIGEFETFLEKGA